jgi:hypothetical protein
MQPNSMFVEAEDPSSPASSDNSQSQPSMHLLPDDPIEFDWRNNWLKGTSNAYSGEEYSHMLRNIDRYCAKFDFARYPRKTHP